MSEFDIVGLLEEGREKIQKGWWRATHAGLPEAWDPAPGFGQLDCLCIAQSVEHHTEAGYYISKALGLTWDPENERWERIWKLNDSQPVETGRQWAIDTLTKAIELAKQDQAVTSGQK